MVMYVGLGILNRHDKTLTLTFGVGTLVWGFLFVDRMSV
jgi:hypothetical protein